MARCQYNSKEPGGPTQTAFDFAGALARELETELAARGQTLNVVERPGDHPFADYAANGSIREAFEFALAGLRNC